MISQNAKVDLKIRSYKFSISTIKFIESLDMKRTYKPVIDQLLRSSTSIGANVVKLNPQVQEEILYDTMKLH
jgi:hypothetical protein